MCLHHSARVLEPERPYNAEVPLSYTSETMFALKENTHVNFPLLMPTLALSPVHIKEVNNPPQLPTWKGNQLAAQMGALGWLYRCLGLTLKEAGPSVLGQEFIWTLEKVQSVLASFSVEAKQKGQ